MAHVSGNPAWQPYPDTSTLVTAETLERIENALDALAAGKRVKGPYAPTSYVALASGASGRTAASVVVPDPGYDWVPQAFGTLEARCGANSRAGVGVYRSSYAAANMVAKGSGLDPVNQGSGGNGFWLIGAQPWYPAGSGAPVVAAGAAASARTFLLCPFVDYGSAAIESTNFYAQLLIWAFPAS